MHVGQQIACRYLVDNLAPPATHHFNDLVPLPAPPFPMTTAADKTLTLGAVLRKVT